MKIARKVLILSGIICCLYGVIVLVLVSSMHWFNFAGFIVGGALIAAGVFLEHLAEFRKKTPRIVRIILCMVIAAAVVHFGCFEAKVIECANSLPAEDAKYIIILGAKVNGSTPSLEYQRRIEAALDYAKDHPGTIIVCTGGKGSDEGIPESQAAYDYLLAQGIDRERLFKEEKSTSTTENFIYAKQEIARSTAMYMSDTSSAEVLLCNYESLKPENVVVVSSSFHLYRAALIAEKQGYDMDTMSFLGSRGLKVLMPHYYLREYAAYVRELL